MDYYNNYGMNRGYAEPAVSPAEYMAHTYRWMGMGLMLTFGVALVTAFTPLLWVVNALYLPLTLAELVLVIVMSARVNKMSVGAARGSFMAYAVINGMVLSYYFVLFEMSSLILAFLSAALYFGLMAYYGHTTERDLSGWGRRLMIGLVAMLICGVVGMLLGGAFVTSALYSAAGLIMFMLLTAYDTQKLQQMYSYYAYDSALAEKASIYGALTLYLDFINIFLYVVRLMGRRRRN